MKVSVICFLLVAFLSATSVDLVPNLPSNEDVKTKWIRALEDSDVLPGGRIKVSLKKGSKLIHPETFDGKSIDVTLVGEGSFQVLDGYQIAVRYKEVIVVVSGASFSVTKARCIIEVAAHDNEVVTSDGGQHVTISRFQKATYDSVSTRFTVIDTRIQMT